MGFSAFGLGLGLGLAAAVLFRGTPAVFVINLIVFLTVALGRSAAGRLSAFFFVALAGRTVASGRFTATFFGLAPALLAAAVACFLAIFLSSPSGPSSLIMLRAEAAIKPPMRSPDLIRHARWPYFGCDYRCAPKNRYALPCPPA